MVRLLVMVLCCLLYSSITQAQDIKNASPARSRPQPISVFATLPFMEGAILSPNGLSFAAKVSIGGRQSFAIIDVAGKVPPVLRGAGEIDINWWTWVNDDWLVLGVGRSVPFEGDEIYVSRAMRISRDGKTFGLLARSANGQNTGQLIWSAHDGGTNILLGVQDSLYFSNEFWPKVLEIDVATGKSKVVVDPKTNVTSWYADGSGTVRMGYAYDDKNRTVRVLYRSSGKGLFRTIDKVHSGDDKKLTVPALFLSTPGKAVAFENSTGFERISDYDVETLSLGAGIFAVDGYDVCCIVSNAANDQLLGISYTDDKPRTHWIDPELKQIQIDLDRVTPGRDARIVSMNRDRSRLLVYLGAPDRMGAYYLFVRAVGTMNLLAYNNPTIKSRPMAAVKTIRYKARDGLVIPAVLTLPKGREAKSLPLVLMPHGGPNARDHEQWDYWAQFVADRGYAVIQPNYRGSTGFGDKFADAGDGEWGLKMQDDLNDAVDHLVAQGIADPKRVCIMGGSYGGYAAMRGAGRDAARFRCAISFAGVADLIALKRYDRTFLNKNFATDWLESRAANLKAVSPAYLVNDMATPLLLIHGKKDLRVPVRQSRSFAKDLAAAGKNVRYVEMPEGDHHLSRQEDRTLFLTEVEAFLAKYNPAN